MLKSILNHLYLTKPMDNFISVSQAAEKLGVSRSRIIALCKQGRIEGVQKLGNALAIPAIFVISDGTRGPGFQKITQDIK